MVLNPSLYLSEKADWGTPQSLFDQVDQEFQFDLDVCATDENAKCPLYFTEEVDGLIQPWTGWTCWCNPPYGSEIALWVEKACYEGQQGVTVVCLLPCRTDTKWWNDFVMQAREIRFISRRLKFEGAGNMAPFCAALVVFGPTDEPVKVSTFYYAR